MLHALGLPALGRLLGVVDDGLAADRFAPAITAVLQAALAVEVRATSAVAPINRRAVTIDMAEKSGGFDDKDWAQVWRSFRGFEPAAAILLTAPRLQAEWC